MTASNPPDNSETEERAAALDRDAALVERVRAGDLAAFDALVHAYMRQAFQLAYRVVGHREDAEDLVQEAFLAAYQYLDSYDASRPFGPWLMRIVLNRGANLRRSRARRETEPETDAVSPAPSALDESERSEAREIGGRGSRRCSPIRAPRSTAARSGAAREVREDGGGAGGRRTVILSFPFPPVASATALQYPMGFPDDRGSDTPS